MTDAPAESAVERARQLLANEAAWDDDHVAALIAELCAIIDQHTADLRKLSTRTTGDDRTDLRMLYAYEAGVMEAEARLADENRALRAERGLRAAAEQELRAEVRALREQLDAAQLRSIEARNPGIDMEEVRRVRLAHPDPERHETVSRAKYGASLAADTDAAADRVTLADRLDDLANDRRWDCWNQHGGGSLDVPEGYDPSPDCCDAADGANALRAAADGLRQLADENRALREAILDAATELGLTHEPDWASDKAKADGKDPVWCRICGPADGSWPCTSQMVVTDLLAAADRGVREGQSARDSALAVFDACTPDQLLTLSQMALDMARIKSAAADRGVTNGDRNEGDER